MTYGESLATKIDETFASKIAETEDSMRSHLGASILGDSCHRKIFFQWRWADSEPFSGRMLRLFETGQLYEERFVKLLQLVGAIVYTHMPDGKQFKVSAHGGHMGGSCDGVAVNLPDLPEPVLLEMKTFNARGFAILKAQGVHNAKPQHVKQAMIYMHLLKLKQCLYLAISKDTDELHLELFNYDPAMAQQLMDKAESIIFAPGLPMRISETPAWFECKFCSMSGVCFKTKAAKVNCRTCIYSKPERTGGWSCAKGRSEIVDAPKKGCEKYEVMNELKL